MAGNMQVHYGTQDWLWQCQDNVTLAAIERAFRDKLAAGETVYFSATSVSALTGHDYGTVVIPPSAFVTFTYTDYDGSELSALAARVVELVDRDGGLTVDANDQIIDTP